MGYEKLISGLIATVVSPQFESMKMNITHLAWISEDGQGGNTFDPSGPVTRRALVDFTGRGMLKYTKAGVLIQEMATLTFLDPIPNNGAAGRQEPIDLRDVITLQDGSTAPVIDTGGFGDSQTGKPFALTVTLGTVIRGA